MAIGKADCLSLEFWNQLMGKDLPNTDRQPLQPVMIEEGRLKLSADTLKTHFSPGAKVGFDLHDGRVSLEETPDGVAVEDDGQQVFELSQDILDALPRGPQVFAMLVEEGEGVQLLPIRVEEHPPDVLGPRLIDEVREPEGTSIGTIVRHLVRGLEYGDWTAARVQELEDLVCSEPFGHDPVPQLVAEGDWVAWQARQGILEQPGADGEQLHQRLLDHIFAGQSDDGSWESSVVTTAYGILRALSIDGAPNDGRIQKAAQWLLDSPEPEGRPGWWMLNEGYLEKWRAKRAGAGEDVELMNRGFSEDDHDLFRGQEQQQVIPSCSRHHAAPCDSLHHPSATAAMALCRCGHADHPRLKAYANTMLDLHAMFGYFCACWGILDTKRDLESLRGEEPSFDHSPDEEEIALKSIPYGYARDNADLHAPARRPWYPGVHRPDLADTNYQPPYDWKGIGVANHFALVGSYWENADCWAKANRALSQFPDWSGSTAEFFSLFQCHLYQTPLGEWHQAFPAGIFRWLAEVTHHTRSRQTMEDSPSLRFAKVMLLKSIPWLRAHQEDDGLWNHDELPRGTDKNRPVSRRLGTYHVASVLNDFGLLHPLIPRG